MQLVNGVALVARLAKSADDLGVLLWESAPVTELLRENHQVQGAVVQHRQRFDPHQGTQGGGARGRRFRQ